MGELQCQPDEAWKNRLLYGGLLSFGVFALVMWWFVYRKLPLRLDEEGITLRDGRTFLWRDMTTFVRGEDLAVTFGETTVSILPSDLANGAEVMKFASTRLEQTKSARTKKKLGPAPVALDAEAETKSKDEPRKRGKVGSNLHFLTTFKNGNTRSAIESRLGEKARLEFDEEKSTLHQDTRAVPPFDRVKYVFADDALRSIELELAFRGDWVDYEALCHDALFSLEGIDTLLERDGRPFLPGRARARLEAASTRVAGVMFDGKHPAGKLTGVMRARAQGYHQIYVLTVTWTPTPPVVVEEAGAQSAADAVQPSTGADEQP